MEAKLLYDEAFKRLVDGGKMADTRLATCDLKLGVILTRQGQYSQANTHFAQALNITERLNGPLHASLAPILDQYADSLDRSNKHTEASAMHARAKAITQPM
jgi:tetratricopeptide (TPR) repeat protein